MRVHTSIKCAFAGGVGATAVLAATAAFAGTGIGGVFNLGQSNSVNGTSTLTGATAGKAQLQVTNTSTTAASTGVAITTAAGRAPLSVSNTTLVPRLNAQYVGGYPASGLGRVGMASNQNLFGPGSTTTQATVSITAPAKGFVRLDGRITAYDGFSSALCEDCGISARLHDNVVNIDSPDAYVQQGGSTRPTGMVIPVSWVFPVTASGVHTYSLTTGQLVLAGTGSYQFYNPVLTAQYVPFGATGTATSLSASAQATTARTLSTRRAPR